MQVTALKTHKIKSKELIFDLLDQYVLPLSEKSIVVVTSKVISLCEGRVIQKTSVPVKFDLIKENAEAYLEEDTYGVYLTIKNGILIPSAGIDESNGEDVYILYPKNTQKSATEIWTHLRKRDNLKNLGILITDSHTTPLRQGTVGIGLGWCGFKPLYDYVGKPDCFGTPYRFTKLNLIDSLASTAVLVMGEGNEQTPLALIKNAPKISFQSRPPTKSEIAEISIPLEKDLYSPLLTKAPWVLPK